MEGDDYEEFENSQQSQDGGGGKKKKKKSKKSKRNLEEDFNDAQQLFEGEGEEEAYTQESILEDTEETTVSQSKKKKSKKKRATRTPSPHQNEEDQAEPARSPAIVKSPKKEPVTPLKKAAAGKPASTPRADGATKNSNSKVDLTEGINIIAAMSHDDIELLLNKVEAECPLNDVKKLASREAQVDWSKIAFSCYGAQQCRAAWTFLMNQARKHRIMYEVVQEVKYNLKNDYHKFMRKSIEAAPDFPKQPYGTGSFQYFCREKWDEYKHLQERMNKRVENFIFFQKKLHEKWLSMSDDQKKEYEQKAELVNAEHKLKVKEFYAKYPGFEPVEKLNKDGKPEAKEKPMSDYYRKQALKRSQEMFKDAPMEPLTPMQLYIQHKIKRTEPTPEDSELPAVKSHYVGKWKEMSGDKKLKWIQKCIKYIERYQLEVAEYKKSHPMFLLPREFQISKLINKEEFGIWTEHHGQPPKPKTTIFEYFVQEFRNSAEVTEETEEDFMKLANRKFNALSALEKEHYKLSFRMHNLNFRKELEDYMSTVPTMLRSTVIDNLPKKYQNQFLEEVDKEPLVKEEDLLEVVDDDGASAGKGTSQKRKNRDDDGATSEDSEQEGVGSQTKGKKKKKRAEGAGNAIPLYAAELGEEHKRLIDEQMKERRKKDAEKDEKRKGDRKEMYDGLKANAFFPGKDISPRILNEAIRGIFDGRQFERRFTVYYYYAKYVARDKSWLALYQTIGIVETAARIIETFNRLSKHQQQIFLDEAYRFHFSTRFYDKQVSNEEELLIPKLRYFPEEPKPPPRKAALIYQREMRLEKIKDANHEAPPWAQLDDETQMRYLKKLYRLNREYIKEYENFVVNMTPNDMIEYLIRKSLEWDVDKGKEKRCFDHVVYGTAESARAPLARETYTLEMSDDGQESEPELLSVEDGALIRDKLGTHKFRYKRNPFSVRKHAMANQSKNALIERLCENAPTSTSNLDSDLPSSTSDEDEEKYGHLVRSDAEKKKDKQFRSKLRAMQRHYYPLEDLYENLDTARLKVNKRCLESRNGRRLALEAVHDQQYRWAEIRAFINSKPKPQTVAVPQRPTKSAKRVPVKKPGLAAKAKGKAKVTAKTKSGRKILPRKSKSPVKKGNVVSRAPPSLETPDPQQLIQAAMDLMKSQTPVGYHTKFQKRRPPSGTKSPINRPRQRDEMEDSDDDVIDTEEFAEMPPRSTTPFIQTAESRPESEADDSEDDQEITPELVNSPPRQPSFMLVRHSPIRMIPPQHQQRKQTRGSPRGRAFPGTFPSTPSSPIQPVHLSGSEAEPVIPTMTPTLQEGDGSSDEFRILDSLADVQGELGVFSESELNQFNDLMM